MRYAIALTLIITGCSIARIDTLKNCSMEVESFASWAYWKIIDCTDIEDLRRDNPTKAEETLKGSKESDK